MHLDRGLDDHKTWFKEHNSQCWINHNCSFGHMETKGALHLFSDSIDKRKSKYSIIILQHQTEMISQLDQLASGNFSSF